MKKIADILIKGNILITTPLRGGGIFTCTSLNQAREHFEIEDALILTGNLSMVSIDSKDKVVVVVGGITQIDNYER